MMRLLVSVRDPDEALLAAGAGADFIDLKDPAAGALGGLPPARIAQIVSALRAAHPDRPISATIGDFAAARREPILRQVAAVAACGVDYVKVGIEPGPHAAALLAALAVSGAAVVPVLIADAGIELPLVEAVLAHEAFAAVMLDTADKRAGSLVERVPAGMLAQFVATVRRRGRLAGLAGALRLADLPALIALAPDFAGFRSAVCAESRAGALEAEKVRALSQALRRNSPCEQCVP